MSNSAPSQDDDDVEPPNPQWYQQNPVGFTAGKSSSDHVLAIGLLLKPSEFEDLRTKTRTLCTNAQLLNKKYVKQSSKTHRDEQLVNITKSLQPTFSLDRVPDQTWLRYAILAIFTKLNAVQTSSNNVTATSNPSRDVPTAALSSISMCKHRSGSAITTVGEIMGWVMRHGSSTEPVRAFIYDYCMDRTKYSSQEARGPDINFEAWFSHQVRERGEIDETSEELVWLDHYDNQVRHLDVENFALAINEAIALGQRNLPFLIRPIGSEVGREELCASTFSPTSLIRGPSAGRAARYVLYLSAFPSIPQHVLTPLRPEKTILIFEHTRTIPARPAVPATIPRSQATNPPPSASLPVGGVAPFTDRDLENEQDSVIDNLVSESSAGLPEWQDKGLPSSPDSNSFSGVLVLPDAPEPLSVSTAFEPNGTGSQGGKDSQNRQAGSRMPERPQSLPPRPCAAHHGAPRARSLSPALSHFASAPVLLSDHLGPGRRMIPALSPEVFSRLPKSPHLAIAGKLSRRLSASSLEEDVRPAKRNRKSLGKPSNIHRTPPISPSTPRKRQRLVQKDTNTSSDSRLTSPEPPAAILDLENVGEGDIVDFAAFGRTDDSNEVTTKPALKQL
jgi:hypothetical protein